MRPFSDRRRRPCSTISFHVPLTKKPTTAESCPVHVLCSNDSYASKEVNRSPFSAWKCLRSRSAAFTAASHAEGHWFGPSRDHSPVYLRQHPNARTGLSSWIFLSVRFLSGRKSTVLVHPAQSMSHATFCASGPEGVPTRLSRMVLRQNRFRPPEAGRSGTRPRSGRLFRSTTLAI